MRRFSRSGSTPALVQPVLVIGLGCSAPLAAQPSDRFTLEDLGRMKTPAATAVSPDGRLVAYTLIAPDSLGREYVQGVWVVDATGGTAVPLAARGATPRWSPDGRQIAYLSRDGAPGGIPQLFVISPTGAERRRLTSSGTPITDFGWAPDGSRIAFIAAANEDGVARPQIHVLDITTGDVRQLTHIEQHVIVNAWEVDANLSWSPDGNRIAFSAKPTPKFDDDYASDIYQVDVRTGEVRPVARRPGMDMRPLWSPDGALIAFKSSFGEVDRFADHGIALVSPDGGAPRDLVEAFDGGFLDGPYQYAWSPDGRTLFFTGADSLSTAIFAVEARSGRTRRLTGSGGQRSVLSVASRAPRMAFIMSDAATPWDVYVSDLVSYAPRRLTRSNSHLGQRRVAPSEAVRWRSGPWHLDGVLVRPVDRPRPAPSPLVVIIHGGPEGSVRMGFEPELPHPFFNYDGGPHPAQLYAARGYAVFLPNFRGSGGHGRALRRAGAIDWSRTFLDDVMAGIDTLVRRGIADSTRLFAVGSRSGATKVVSLLTNTKRFRAAYVHNPYPDIIAEYGQPEDDFHLMHHGLFGGSPAAVPDVYARESPINGVARISTPIQIVADENAVGIRSSQSLLFHQRLLERGVAGELILFRHRDIPATIELLRRNLAWLDRWTLAP